LEEVKGQIRNHKSRDRQYKGEKTNSALQNTTHKTKDWATRNLWWTRVFRNVYSSCATNGTRRLTLAHLLTQNHSYC